MFSDDQIQRYSRQIILGEVGSAGQRKLLGSRVLIVGAGGLGSPAALYLAGAGIGTLGIVDKDVVDISNLHRQILHTMLDTGRHKTDSAEEKIRIRNPDVNVVTYKLSFSAANALDLVKQYDFVVDGADNFATKFLIADACHFAGVPYSHAGIRQWSGQTMTVVPGKTTCYRCVFRAPPSGPVDTCAESGIMGPVAGIIGTMQATEAIKSILGAGELLTDRLLEFDGLAMSFREVRLHRSTTCPLCGVNPGITAVEGPPSASGACCAGGRCCR